MLAELPFTGIRIAEKSNLLTGRMLTQMFADQGATVYIARTNEHIRDQHDDYLDRGKISVAPCELEDVSTIDVIVVDGKETVPRLPGQFVVHVVSALPGDAAYGHLADDCSEDLLNALVGFFTDMGQSSRLLGRPVIYTPLPLCSIYAAVVAANMLAAALYDRERTGHGRDIWASRLAGGVSAIGALALTTEGLDLYLKPKKMELPPGIASQRIEQVLNDARADGNKQLWLEQHISPLGTPYPTSDGRMAMCLGAANRRLAERMLKGLGIYDAVMAAGFVDVTPFRADNLAYRGHNLGEPMTLSWEYSAKLAEMVGAAFKTRTAAEWERYLSADWRTPCTTIHSWEEWKVDGSAHTAGIFTAVEGDAYKQIGRVGWIDSARPYPSLKACVRGAVEGGSIRDLHAMPLGAAHYRPLEGLVVADFTDVIAGPNCGRMFAELGAAVRKIDPINPKHTPEIMVDWAGESGAGKQSIILNFATPEARKIMKSLVGDCDIVIANKLDDQWERIGIGRAALDELKPGIIQVALTAYRGEHPRGERHNYPGYDPALQGMTGIMMRFGPEGCPTFHGLASCVDYLCGYLGVWAGLCALYAQTRRGGTSGDWAETSLAVAATLTQCLLQQTTEPTSARGAEATGMTEGARVYKVTDGWIFAQGDQDLTDELSGMNRAVALNLLASKSIPAVPVQTCRELADQHLVAPTSTVRFQQREHQGLITGTFAASWFAVDGGKPLGSPAAAHRVGSDAKAMLAPLGYSSEDVDRLIEKGILGAVEFANTTDS